VPSLSFRGAARDEQSRMPFVSRARFLTSLRMTAVTKVFQHPDRETLQLQKKTLK
jgi:hypothetical protein